jgi:hypothetical protein
LNEEKDEGLDYFEKKEIGLMVKRILDFGRLMYIES